MGDIILPWPSPKLAGHTGGKGSHWRAKHDVTTKHRAWARDAALAAHVHADDGKGDIRLIVAFYPPHRRGDRTNYPNLMKPYYDGIADALKVNDRRFVPSFIFADPMRPFGQVVVSVLG